MSRRIRVYWPLDEAWYEGCVKSFDRISVKHLVEYDDGEEEMIDLSKEKFEWISLDGPSSIGKSRKRRLRKVSLVVDDDDEEEKEGNVGSVEDDSSDEDWGKNAAVEEDDCLEDMELVDEEKEEEVGRLKRKKGEIGGGGAKKKLKEGDGPGTDTSKKKKNVGVGDFGSKPGKPVTNDQEAKPPNVADGMQTDALERFGIREEQKFPFLGKDRQDANRRRPGDADYDPKTLYLPPQFLKNLTGGQVNMLTCNYAC